MANTNKEPNLVRAYLDKRDEMRAPCYHIITYGNRVGQRVRCTGPRCEWCNRKERQK